MRVGLEEKASGLRNRDFGLGEGGTSAARYRVQDQEAGGGGGKPLEALFCLPAVKTSSKNGHSNTYLYYLCDPPGMWCNLT